MRLNYNRDAIADFEIPKSDNMIHVIKCDAQPLRHLRITKTVSLQEQKYKQTASH